MVSFSFRKALLMATVASVASGVALEAHAAGFYIQEQSVQGLGSAFSGGSTNLNDPSTIFFNPAGMTKLNGTQMQAGVNLLIPEAKVRDTGSTAPAAAATVGGPSGNPYDPSPVPNGFISHQLGDRWWAGIGITAPYGLGSDYGDTWFGRFDSTRTKLEIIDIQPTVAFKINDVASLGFGLNFQHSNADLRSRVLIGAATEANNKLTGKDWGFGYSVGMQFKPLPTTTVGLNYKSEVHHDLDGKIQVTALAGATPANIATAAALTSNGSAKLVTPDQASLGISHQVNDRWTVQGQATWFGWNNFDHISAFRDSGALASRVEQNYQATWAYALGAEYVASEAWTLRGGVQFDETPTTDEYRSSRTPDGDRTWVSLGATYNLDPQWDFDMAATYIHVEDGTINLTRGGGGALGAAGQMRAKTEGQVGILALGVTYKF